MTYSLINLKITTIDVFVKYKKKKKKKRYFIKLYNYIII